MRERALVMLGEKGLAESARASAQDTVSRRIFSITQPGIASLELTRDTRDRLWSGVKLAKLGVRS